MINQLKRRRIIRYGLTIIVLLLTLGEVILSQETVSARNSQRAFVSWARQAAIPMPASPEEPMNDEALSMLERMLKDKRFVFLGEPDHYLIEKFPFRLMFIRNLFDRGWQHVGMEMGRSMGWRLNQYIDTGDTVFLPHSKMEDGYDYRKAFGHMFDFIEQHEPVFFKQLRTLSESRPPGRPRLHFFGFDMDVGHPLAALEPIRSFLKAHDSNDHVRKLLEELNKLDRLEVKHYLPHVEAIQKDLTERQNNFVRTLGKNNWCQLESWICTLRAGVAAVERPRPAQDAPGHRLWRAEREKTMMEQMDDIVAAFSSDDKFILLGHNGHLSKDASNLCFRPQRSVFWGCGSWLRALGYTIHENVIGCPSNMYGKSIGNHLHDRFPGEVLSIWMLYGQGQLMGRDGPIDVRLHGDTIESLLAEVGDRFLLPLDSVDSRARNVLAHANFRWAGGHYASADLTIQADALYFVKNVSAVKD